MITASRAPTASAAEGAVIARGLSYVNAWRGRTVVVKYGGSVIAQQNGDDTVIQDLVLLKGAGINPVLVHGGGPEISRMLERLGRESRFVEGLRVTDDETMDVVEMVLSGRTNKALVGRLIRAGGSAVGVSGRDARLFQAVPVREPADLGRVGQITGVAPGLIDLLARDGHIPVVASVGSDAQGEALNLNADHAAASLAAALGASKLILLTDVAGIYRDHDGRRELFSVVTAAEARELVRDGTVAHGMIPKVEAALEALRGGVPSAHIISGEIPHGLLVELFTEAGVGTMLVSQRTK